MSLVLAVDAGTTSMKMALVRDGRETVALYEKPHSINIRGNEIDLNPEDWWNAFLKGCDSFSDEKKEVQAISFSVSTPGAMALDSKGNPLTPAVLFMDGRSLRQAAKIREVIGEDRLLEHTSNLPASGGATASTILWWKEYQNDTFQHAEIFGHTNTFFGKRLTGNFGMDPSTASLTALYNTTANDRQWNADICEELQIPIEKLPPIVDSWQPVGELLPAVAGRLELPPGIPVLMGGNDAMCAALTGGVTEEGAILDICGTCEIICIGLAKSVPGRNYNIRCHVIPDLWSTLYVLNTGGKALEWFHQVFCSELSADDFYSVFVPNVIDLYFNSDSTWDLPDYDVYLAGDRYSVEAKTGGFSKLTLNVNRECMLMAMIRGNNRYMARHIEEMAQHVKLSNFVHLTGGGLSKPMIRCKTEWMGDFEYGLCENSSVMGAAQLGHFAVTGEKIWSQ